MVVKLDPSHYGKNRDCVSEEGVEKTISSSNRRMEKIA
jgi:hypothetical protein